MGSWVLPWRQHNKSWMKESKIYQNPPTGNNGWLRSEHKWSVLWETPKGISQAKLSWNLTQNVNGTKGAKTVWNVLSDDQQSILLSLKEGRGNLESSKSWLRLNPRENWVGALRKKTRKLEAPLDSSMSLERPQARKNPLSSHETTVPVKP